MKRTISLLGLTALLGGCPKSGELNTNTKEPIPQVCQYINQGFIPLTVLKSLTGCDTCNENNTTSFAVINLNNSNWKEENLHLVDCEYSVNLWVRNFDG